MKTIFDKCLRDELIKRVDLLTVDSNARWGKMNVNQMTRHCIIWDEWILGKNKPVYKQEWLGRIFGKMALRGIVKDDAPLKKGMPAGSAFEVRERGGDIERQKHTWKELLSEYNNFSNPSFIHDFFGKMTTEEIGILAYKHTDHHLRQFGC